MRYRIILLVCALCSMARTTPADAAIVLSVNPSAATYNVGDSGFIDVMIYSTSSDPLDSFLFGLNITGGPGAVFTDPQGEAFLSDSNYVFFGRSANVNNLLPATTVGGSGSTISVADVSYDTLSLPPGDPLPFTLPGIGSPSLLARLEFDAVGPGVFNVDVDLASTFSDVNLNNFDFTSTGGSFTVTAVPEPSSAVLLALGVAGAGWMKRRRARKLILPTA